MGRYIHRIRPHVCHESFGCNGTRLTFNSNAVASHTREFPPDENVLVNTARDKHTAIRRKAHSRYASTMEPPSSWIHALHTHTHKYNETMQITQPMKYKVYLASCALPHINVALAISSSYVLGIRRVCCTQRHIYIHTHRVSLKANDQTGS